MREPECENRTCIHNRKLKCHFLNENGESKHYVGDEKMYMLCAWEDCGRSERCESCNFFAYYKGKQYCDLKKKLIPRGRKACGYYQKTKV